MRHTHIGECIKHAREKKGLNKAQLARHVHVKASAVAQWENGTTRRVDSEHIFALCDELDLDPRALASLSCVCYEQVGPMSKGQLRRLVEQIVEQMLKPRFETKPKNDPEPEEDSSDENPSPLIPKKA